MTKFLLGKPADQGSRVAKLCAAFDFRPAKRPDGASETLLWNGSFRQTIAFGPDEHQNGELLARRERLKHDQNRYEKSWPTIFKPHCSTSLAWTTSSWHSSAMAEPD
jgi:hypothetical protein